MSRVIVYKTKERYYTFRCERGCEEVVSAMGEIIFIADADTVEGASAKARYEADKLGLPAIECLRR